MFSYTKKRKFTKRFRGSNVVAKIEDNIWLDAKETDVVIPVMGPTGAGKSTFINEIVGEQLLLVGQKMTSCTTEPCPVVIDPIPGWEETPSLQGRRLVLLDTPGFDDTYLDDAQILKRIAKWLENSYRNKMYLGGILYLHDISIKKFTGTARRNLDLFSRLCGSAAINKVVLVTTCWTGPDNVQEGRREEELKSTHWKSLMQEGAQVTRFFRGHQDSAWDIVDIFLDRIATTRKRSLTETLQIQAEIVDRHLIVPETEAGKELRYSLQQLLEIQKEAAEFEARLAKKGDSDARAKLDEAQEKIKTIRQQIKSLGVPLSRRIRRIFGLSILFAGRLGLSAMSKAREKTSNSRPSVSPATVLKHGKETDIVIPIMGPTGAGKTTFVNMALHEDRLEVGHSLKSTTSQVYPVIIDQIPDFPALQGRRLVLVDTPGFDDTFTDDVRILKQIARWLAQSYRRRMPIGGILYLHDISVKRFNATARKNLEVFRHLCGDAAIQEVVLLTTNWDGPSGSFEEHERREKELKSVHWKDLIERRAETRRFQRNGHSAWEILRVFLNHIAEHERLTLLIQTEMVEHRLRIQQTEAGRVLLNTLQDTLNACKELTSLEAMAAQGNDPHARAKLDESKANIMRLKEQIRALNVSLPQRVLQWIGFRFVIDHDYPTLDRLQPMASNL